MSVESPAAPIHTYSTGTLVYEVNLSVPREKAEEYIEWLRGFTKALQRIPGFLSSMVFRQPKPYGLHWLSEEGNNKTYITVHYVIESQEALKSYLENDQPKVAAAEQERFEFLVTSRRTLSVVF
ncbi:hypothetical protein BGZ80_005255 [Entomortierella chlamydospora]|uniref:Uncharacterized protein n=1 Tax=Entomortierella chlamydospora TaxID=101097 RepID=A0A9P6T2A9_9FUNG|nr:hypothetical protein BGZ80_005255 [Entomortierella chlamydospora]